MPSNSSLKKELKISEEGHAKDGAEIAEPKAKNMDNNAQLKRLKEIKTLKNEILRNIDKENVNLMDDISQYLHELQRLNIEQKQIWKARHKVKRLKYDQSDRGRELARIRSLKNYHKKKEAKVAQ